MKLQILLLVLILSGARSLTNDQIISRAGERAGQRRRGSSSPRVDGGRAELKELDIAVPLLCKVPTASSSSVTIQTDVPDCVIERRRRKRAIPTFVTKWPKTIPYVIDGSFSTAELNNIQAAFDEYALYSCVRFVQRTNQANYFRIVRDGGCWSYLGFVSSRNPQRLSLSNGCASGKGIPIHEFFHLIGSLHQQARPDRDDHVRIIEENIQDGRENQFTKNPTAATFTTPYSFCSVMHYGRTAFSKNGMDTIKTINPLYQDVIGNRETFSFEDLLVLNRFMECDTQYEVQCGSPNPCLPSQYLGADCQCYCRNNKTVPAIPCSQTTECLTVGEQCSCTQKKCSGLTNTVCKDGACECSPGYTAGTGGCVAGDGVCDKPDKPCGCSNKGPNACNGVANSECEPDSGACKCIEDFYHKISKSKCKATKACKKTNKNCQCGAQGQDACHPIKLSSCNAATGKCECPIGTTRKSKKCKPDCKSTFISDGTQLNPFTNDPGASSDFISQMGAESPAGVSFGVNPNGYRLHAEGSGSETAILLAPEFKDTSSINICVSFNLQVAYGRLSIERRTNGGPWNANALQANGVSSWSTFTFTYTVADPANFEMRFVASEFPATASPTWEVNVDPLAIYCC